MLSQYIALQTLLRNRREERGATAVEYGLMVALIAVAIIGAVALIGTELNNLFADVTDKLPDA